MIFVKASYVVRYHLADATVFQLHAGRKLNGEQGEAH